MKMKRLYRKRRDALIHSLEHAFGNRVHILGDATGLHLVAEFPGIDFTADSIRQSLEQAGVHIYPVEMHAIHKGLHCHQIILGYGNLTAEQMEDGVTRIAQVIKTLNFPY